jgi:hypothetical protein
MKRRAEDNNRINHLTLDETTGDDTPRIRVPSPRSMFTMSDPDRNLRYRNSHRYGACTQFEATQISTDMRICPSLFQRACK